VPEPPEPPLEQATAIAVVAKTTASTATLATREGDGGMQSGEQTERGGVKARRGDGLRRVAHTAYDFCARSA